MTTISSGSGNVVLKNGFRTTLALLIVGYIDTTEGNSFFFFPTRALMSSSFGNPYTKRGSPMMVMSVEVKLPGFSIMSLSFREMERESRLSILRYSRLCSFLP